MGCQKIRAPTGPFGGTIIFNSSIEIQTLLFEIFNVD